jgi:hypothetical protein
MNQEEKYNQSVLNAAVGNASLGNMFRIGARCIAEIGGRFFLLVNVEIGPEGSEIEQVIIFRISAALAATLLRAGVRRCQIVNMIPSPTPGRQVTLVCGFVEAGNIFLVFDIENSTDELVLVRVPQCIIAG